MEPGFSGWDGIVWTHRRLKAVRVMIPEIASAYTMLRFRELAIQAWNFRAPIAPWQGFPGLITDLAKARGDQVCATAGMMEWWNNGISCVRAIAPWQGFPRLITDLAKARGDQVCATAGIMESWKDGIPDKARAGSCDGFQEDWMMPAPAKGGQAPTQEFKEAGGEDGWWCGYDRGDPAVHGME
ncbi:MAG: hypothetical protein HY563_08685 [Ignavibacteriales bacterium]|nr:hypothetical protein [Ignavibacteriales bacterium]